MKTEHLSTFRLTRRGFLGGLAATVTTAILAACGSAAPTATPAATAAPTTTTTPPTTAPPTATTAPSPTAGSVTAAPAASTAASSSKVAGTAAPSQNLTLPATFKRGQGGAVRLLWWEAPTILNPHLAQGTKDFDAARPVIEPFATFSNAGATTPDIPVLAKEVPTVANGGLASDGTSVTWKLKPGVVWSDGQPLTPDDVIFTWKFVTDPKNGATTIENYTHIKEITAPDATTVKITFKEPTAVWYLPFTGTEGGVLPKHILTSCTNPTQCSFNQQPIGTGPYVVTAFAPGDHVSYAPNAKFREPNAPYFSSVEMKGGGEATTAVQAVIAGQADYAWNPQVAPEILKQLTDSGNILATVPGASAEKIFVNFADPSTTVDGEKSSPKSKNPFWSDRNVRQALALAIDRQTLATNLYGPAGKATNTLIPTIWNGAPWTYDPRKANTLLDAAGWKKGSDGIRVKNGKKFSITFRTSVNSLRDRESQVIKNNLQAVGIAVDLRPVNASVFFGQPDNPDNLARFQTDLEMYTNGSSFPDMQAYLEGWTTAQITQKSNGWKGLNVMRWSNPEYDQTVAGLKTVLDPAKRVEIFKKADAIVTGDYAQIPLVARTGLAAYAKGLEGVNLTPWDSDLWNIAHWTKQ